jgi:hypothetical protein
LSTLIQLLVSNLDGVALLALVLQKAEDSSPDDAKDDDVAYTIS